MAKSQWDVLWEVTKEGKPLITIEGKEKEVEEDRKKFSSLFPSEEGWEVRFLGPITK